MLSLKKLLFRGGAPSGLPEDVRASLDAWRASKAPALDYLHFHTRYVVVDILPSFLQLTPEYRHYIWGGEKLRPGHNPTAEAWVVYEKDRIEAGALAGKTLSEAANEFGAPLLGEKVFARTGTRFPLLVKLLDCAQWLSVQVHPNDEQAVQLEGPGQFGKTEAWHVLEAQPEAKLIAGIKPGASAVEIAEAIRNGTITEYSQYANVKQGDTVFMPAGTLHALGPGLLIYEVQQTSDWTYRVYDWGRPQTETRRLHIDKSIAVTRHDLAAPILPAPAFGDGTRHISHPMRILHARINFRIHADH